MAEHGDQERLQGLLQERREHEQAPDAVDDAGNAGEQFDGDADRAAQPQRAQFGQKQRDEQADRHRDQHGDERRHDGAVDRREGAEFFGDRVPTLGHQKTEAEGAQRRQGAVDQRNNDAAEDDEHRDGAGAGQLTENQIANLQTLRALCSDQPDRRPRGLRLVTLHRPPAGSRAGCIRLSLGPARLGSHSSGPAAAKTSRLVTSGDREKAPRMAPFPMFERAFSRSTCRRRP